MEILVVIMYTLTSETLYTVVGFRNIAMLKMHMAVIYCPTPQYMCLLCMPFCFENFVHWHSFSETRNH